MKGRSTRAQDLGRRGRAEPWYRSAVRIWWASAVLVVVLLAATSPTAACSPPIDAGPCPRGTPQPFPGGASDAPLNTEVTVEWVSYATGAEIRVPSTTFRLTTETGEVIPLEPSSTSNRWRPTADLLPRTVYVLEDQVELELGDAGCAPASAFVEVGRFTTGAQRDDLPPAMPSEARVDVCCEYTACDDGGCCGSWSAARRRVEWTVDVDTSILAYRVGSEVVFGGPSASVGWSTAGMFGFRLFVPTFPAGEVEARAIDGAGNVSEWTAAVTVAGCDMTLRRPDGGTGSFSPMWDDSCTGPVDAGVRPMDASMDASVAPAPGGSCGSCAATSPAPRASGLALGVLAALVVRRRRAAAARS